MPTRKATSRPDPHRITARARRGAGRALDLLLVYRVDRLARSVRGLAQILDDLDHTGVAFRSATEPFDTASPAGRMMMQMLGVFAEFERATIIDRVVAGMERKAARGGWLGGNAPYGYSISPDGAALVINPAEAPLVPIIFRQYVHGRKGTHALAGWLGAHGHATRTGRPWSNRAVLTVLRNRVYLGEVNFRGQSHPSTHPPLADPELFDAAQQILSARGEQPTLRLANGSDYLLTGLIVCDACGRHYLGTAAHGRNAKYSYYTCYSRTRYGNHVCTADRLPAKALEDAYVHALLAVFEHDQLIDDAIAQASTQLDTGRAELREEQASVTAEIGKAEAALDRYLTAFETGDLPQADCAPRVQRLSRRLADLRIRRDELERQLEQTTVTPPTPDELAALRANLRRLVDGDRDPDAKLLVQALTEEIRVYSRSRIKPTFRLPDNGSSSLAAVRDQSTTVDRLGVEPQDRAGTRWCAGPRTGP